MKTSLFLLLLATPALAQVPAIPVVPAVSATKPAEAKLSPTWEFAPDFLRDQNQIIWRASSAPKALAFLVMSTNGAGLPLKQTLQFVDITGQMPMGTLAVTYDKSGKMQKQELRDPSGMPMLGIGNGLPLVETTLEPNNAMRQVFLFLTGDGDVTLTSDYDARGRRTRDVLTLGAQTLRTLIYVYDAKDLSAIEDGATRLTIERDASGKMRSMSAIQNGLLTRSATPLRDDKNNVIGTRTENYSGGVLREVNEITLEGTTPKNSRVKQSFGDTTTVENGQQTTRQTFDFRMDVSPPKTPVVEVRKRTIYRNAKIVAQEIYRDGVLTMRDDFGADGMLAKTTNFDADGSVASTFDAPKSTYADGSIIRRSR